MRTLDHPAFIPNYNYTYTDVLRTRPNGTYALLALESEPNSYMIVYSFDGAVKGLKYKEINGGNKLQVNARVNGWFPEQLTLDSISIDQIVGNGIDDHKYLKDADYPIQLIGTLNAELNKDAALAAKVSKTGELPELSEKAQEAIKDLDARIKSGEYRWESNQIMAVAKQLFQGRKGEDEESYNQIIKGTYALVNKEEAHDSFLMDYNYKIISEAIFAASKKYSSFYSANKTTSPALFSQNSTEKAPMEVEDVNLRQTNSRK